MGGGTEHNSKQIKNFSKKHSSGLFVLIFLLLTLLIAAFWCTKKEGMFLDEIYSYGLSNSYYEPFLKNVKDGDFIDSIFTRQELEDYLAVSPEEKFSFDSVVYNQTQDVHPPLFYCFLHAISSLYPNIFSKWIGLGLNLLYFLITLVFIWKISKIIFKDNPYICALMIVLYGSTTYAISNVIFVRMYMLSTMLTVILAYLILKIIEKRTGYLCILAGAVVCLGLLSHYFFVFYAFFISAFLVIYLLLKKEYRLAIESSVFLILGVLLFIVLFPKCFQHMTAKTGTGTTTIEYISSFGLRRVFSLCYSFAKKYFIPAIFGIILFPLLFVDLKKTRDTIISPETKSYAFAILIGPAILSLLAISLVSADTRYIANITPFFVFIVGYIVLLLKVDFKSRITKTLLIEVLLIAICSSVVSRPSYLYTEYDTYDQTLSKFNDYSCAYFTENRNPSITQDLLQLLNFDEVIVFNDPDSEFFESNVKDIQEGKGLIVYFASYPEPLTSQDTINRISSKTGFSDVELLYNNGWSEVYRFSK